MHNQKNYTTVLRHKFKFNTMSQYEHIYMLCRGLYLTLFTRKENFNKYNETGGDYNYTYAMSNVTKIDRCIERKFHGVDQCSL